MAGTCALCGFRDATTITDWDGRPVLACPTCTRVPDDLAPPSRAFDLNRASLALRVAHYVFGPGADGADVSEVAAALDHDRSKIERNAISAALSRLVRQGFLDVTGTHQFRIYRPGQRPIESGRWKGIREKRAA